MIEPSTSSMCRLERVHQNAFVVGLHLDQIDIQFFRDGIQFGIDLVESHCAVDLRLTPSEKIQVRPVQD